MSDAPPEPPPPRPSTSPFGRFPTQIVGMLAVLVAGVAAVSFSMSNNAASPPDASPGLEGSWQGQASIVGGEEAALRLEIREDGTGTLRRAGCLGTLTPAQTMGGSAQFDYSSSERGCPRRTQVSITQVGPDTLRLEERRLNGRPLLDATLERR